MKPMQFSTDINATKESVWNTLWQDDTFRDWAGLIDPETFMVGGLKEGNEVQFISGNSGYGVTALVERLVENELVIFRHSADTQDNGENEREKQWTGGQERYELSEDNGIITLITEFDVPPELEEYFQEHYPVALARIKELAESS